MKNTKKQDNNIRNLSNRIYHGFLIFQVNPSMMRVEFVNNLICLNFQPQCQGSIQAMPRLPPSKILRIDNPMLDPIHNKVNSINQVQPH